MITGTAADLFRIENAASDALRSVVNQETLAAQLDLRERMLSAARDYCHMGVQVPCDGTDARYAGMIGLMYGAGNQAYESLMERLGFDLYNLTPGAQNFIQGPLKKAARANLIGEDVFLCGMVEQVLSELEANNMPQLSPGTYMQPAPRMRQ